MGDILVLSLWMGLSAASTTILIRYAPTMQKRVQEGQKPIACDVCMSLWTTLGMALLAWRACGTPWLAVVQAGLPAYAVAKWTVGRLMDPVYFPSFASMPETAEDAALAARQDASGAGDVSETAPTIPPARPDMSGIQSVRPLTDGDIIFVPSKNDKKEHDREP